MKNTARSIGRALALIALGGSLTWAQAADDFSFVHLTDLHVRSTSNNGTIIRKLVTGGDVDGAMFKKVIAKINALSPEPAFVVISGDIGHWSQDTGIYPGKDNLTAFFNCLKYDSRTAMYYLKTVSGAYHIPVYTVAGNHDYRKYDGISTSTPSNLASMARVPTSDPKLTSAQVKGADQSYAFSHGNTLIVMVNAGADNVGDAVGSPIDWYHHPTSEGLTTAQFNWLNGTDTLSGVLRTTFSNKIVVLHNPLVNTSTLGAATASISHYRDAFLSLCQTAGVRMVLAGHEHQSVVVGPSYGALHVQTGAAMEGVFRVITVKGTVLTAKAPTIVP